MAALAAAGGGVVNSIAGGGTLLTFPALIGLGVSPVVANATSTVALWPGSLASFWGYRGQIQGIRSWWLHWAVPSLLGGLVGALLLIFRSEAEFAALVPWLIWGATALFIVQKPVLAWIGVHTAGHDDVERAAPPVRFLVWQLLVSVYGGYFGAGAGILMLAAFEMMGLRNIHTMNGLKNWCGLSINAIAVAVFVISGKIEWFFALTMAVGAMAGGAIGSRMAQRVGQTWVRRAVIAIGIGGGLATFVKGS
ncbi:MAG TPA: sulfite exporter TauE/SafE family protein [Gemmatimonadaceae bacterium]|nr:sulfite exporter TauE/SafE family protein [Gemmatimonadaceae bacterium]